LKNDFFPFEFEVGEEGAALPRVKIFRIARAIRGEWGDRRDSNPQQPGPQPGALPLSYDHHLVFPVNRWELSYFDSEGEFVNADLAVY
jgi:hypothetical protein